jgi:hypothetical protein
MTGPIDMQASPTDRADDDSPERPDFYLENGLLVFTAAHHLKRGVCCGSGCRHCPYEPKHVEGSRRVRQ